MFGCRTSIKRLLLEKAEGADDGAAVGGRIIDDSCCWLELAVLAKAGCCFFGGWEGPAGGTNSLKSQFAMNPPPLLLLLLAQW
jgi:hypothetical protein